MVHVKPKQIGNRREREKTKITIPVTSYPTRNKEFQINSKKIQKIQKIPLCLHFKKKQVGKGKRKRENKNYRSVSFQLDVLENNSKTNSKKN